MHSKFIFPAIIACSVFIYSCGTTSTPVAGDSAVTQTDTTPGEHGISIASNSNAQPHAVKDSIYDGQHVERYDNGVIYMQGEVKGGLRSGNWMTFYKDGKPWSQGAYKDGFREGYGVSWYANGQKSSEGYYQHDKMVGKWSFWDEYGTLTTKDFPAAK